MRRRFVGASRAMITAAVGMRKRSRRVYGESEGIVRFVEAASSTDYLLIEDVARESQNSKRSNSSGWWGRGRGGGRSRRAQWTLTSSCSNGRRRFKLIARVCSASSCAWVSRVGRSGTTASEAAPHCPSKLSFEIDSIFMPLLSDSSAPPLVPIQLPGSVRLDLKFSGADERQPREHRRSPSNTRQLADPTSTRIPLTYIDITCGLLETPSQTLGKFTAEKVFSRHDAGGCTS